MPPKAQGPTIRVHRASSLHSNGLELPQERSSRALAPITSRAGDPPSSACSLRNPVLFRFLVGLIALGLGLNNFVTGGRLWPSFTRTSSSRWIQADSVLGSANDAVFISKLTGGTGSSQGVQKSREYNQNTTIHIPRVIHQTYHTRQVAPELAELVDTWKRKNRGWETKFYDDSQCLKLVEEEFPEYLEAYLALPKDVERADFFRYLVVLKYGGVYADVDTECRMSIESVIRPQDQLVVGWEAEFASGMEAYERHFVRRRQVLQWVFAAAPGHPALREVCESVAANAKKRFNAAGNRDTLERTGPGMFTDVILKHAQNAEEGISILPRVAFGVHPAGDDGLSPESPGIVVLHHFLGRWKKKGGWVKGHFWERSLNKLRGMKPPEALKMDDTPGSLLYPVTIPWQPSFVTMVYLKGHGEMMSSEVGSTLSMWGNWQASMGPNRHPKVVDALVGSLGVDKKLIFVDVGAGLGFFSLAAASRGHRVLAFEKSPRNLKAFMESLKYNGFNEFVDLHQVELGAQIPGYACPVAHSQQDMMGGSLDHVSHRQGGADQNVTRCVHRVSLVDYAPHNARIGAIRIGAHSNAGWVTNGALPVIAEHMPNVIFIEFLPDAMINSGYRNPKRMLWKLYNLGYQEVYHAGHICDMRWLEITKSMRHQGFFSEDLKPHLKQPTWCRLHEDRFNWLVENIPEDMPENIMLVHRDRGPGSPKLQDVATGDQEMENSKKIVEQSFML